MTSLGVRRHSSSVPKVVIGLPEAKESTHCDSSPTLTLSTPPLGGLNHKLPSIITTNGQHSQQTLHPQLNQSTSSGPLPCGSGSLSPDLLPITPPVLTGKGVQQIGKFILVEELEKDVYKAVNIQNGDDQICKVFSRKEYRTKIAAYCRLYETNTVVEIKEIIQGDKYVYVFFGKNYGDLHSYVKSKKRLKDEEAIRLYRQIAQAVAQCHQCGVVIRDLKLRKFVFTDPERTRIQLGGLEESHILEDEENDTLCDKQGSPAYVSPEILESAKSGYSGKASDQWSSGVMLYTMLIGRYPFQEQQPADLFRKIRMGKYIIPPHLSSKAKCLIRSLLRRDASERLTSEEVLLHPWFKSNPNDSLLACSALSRDSINDHRVPKWEEL